MRFAWHMIFLGLMMGCIVYLLLTGNTTQPPKSESFINGVNPITGGTDGYDPVDRMSDGANALNRPKVGGGYPFRAKLGTGMPSRSSAPRGYNPAKGPKDSLQGNNGIDTWDGGVGNGYQEMLRRLVWPTGPNAGAAAGAGPQTRQVLPVVADTDMENAYTMEGFQSSLMTNTTTLATGTPVLTIPQVIVGDPSLQGGVMEQSVSSPIFIISSRLVQPSVIDTLKLGLAQSGNFAMNVTSDLPNVVYSFPLLYVVDDVDPTNRNVYAYTFGNPGVRVPGPIFAGARTLSFQVVQTSQSQLNVPGTPRAPNANLPMGAAPAQTTQPNPNAPLFNSASCGGMGYPSPDKTQRLYTRFECNTLGGNWLPDGQCLYTGGGSWSTLCASQNNTAAAVNTSANNIVVQSPMVPIGDPGNGSSMKELHKNYAAFAVSSNLLTESLANRIRTQMIMSNQYKVVITSDVPGLSFAFPLTQISNMTNPTSGQIYAYTLANPNVTKTPSMFASAKSLSFQILSVGTIPEQQQLGDSLPNPVPPPPSGLTSSPPSTMASVIPGTPTELAYQTMREQPLLGASTMAQKIRDGQLPVKCNL